MKVSFAALTTKSRILERGRFVRPAQLTFSQNLNWTLPAQTCRSTYTRDAKVRSTEAVIHLSRRIYGGPRSAVPDLVAVSSFVKPDLQIGERFGRSRLQLDLTPDFRR